MARGHEQAEAVLHERGEVQAVAELGLHAGAGAEAEVDVDVGIAYAFADAFGDQLAQAHLDAGVRMGEHRQPFRQHAGAQRGQRGNAGGREFISAARAGAGARSSGGVPVKRTLHQLAHAHTGDKADTSNISVIAYKAENYPLLAKVLTAERVEAWFAHLHDANAGPVRRYELLQLHALSFVLPGLLRGGVTRSLALDAHGKCLEASWLKMEVE